MNKRQFFEKVALMRESQKEYFRTRSHDALRKSKALEAEIDAEIKRVRDLGYTKFILSHNLTWVYQSS